MNTFRTLLRQNIFLATATAFIAAIFIPLSTTHAAVNDFTISSYAINYTLGRNSDKHSTLTTKETIVADFPQSDQNHGIERAIPKKYDGHPTYLDVKSVTDQNGKSIEYSKLNNSGNYVLQIGDGDTYVHGKQTYVITYTQRDVTRYFSDTNADEFYWDTNGTDWKVPIKDFSVTLKIDDSLASALNGNTACYQGIEGSNDRCELKKDGTTFTTGAEYLSSTENITVALGFKKGTFAAYKATVAETLWSIWLNTQLVLLAFALISLVTIGIKYYRQSNRSSEQKPIAPEYMPPSEGSVAEAAKLFRYSNSFPAQLIDLAVRGYLKIYEVERKALFGKKTDYKLEITKDVASLKAEEQEFVKDVFQTTSVGTTLSMEEMKRDTKLFKRLSDNETKLTELERGTYALRAQASDMQRNFYSRLTKLSIVFAVLLLSPVLAVLAWILFTMKKALWPLTDKGLLLVRKYKGLKMYIKVAEAERLKMLQSPEGAEKVSVDTSDKAQIVKLYEKALPYAMLFGQSKQWNERLGKYYSEANSQPNWYISAAGYSAFNAANFSNAINSFSASATTSSGTGGSSGGGSSGGGGGGGGGGGW